MSSVVSSVETVGLICPMLLQVNHILYVPRANHREGQRGAAFGSSFLFSIEMRGQKDFDYILNR